MTGRWALFSGEDYYPEGGWLDFEKASDSIEELHAVIAHQCEVHVHPGQPAGWVDARTLVSTSMLVINHAPSWATAPPFDAPPRPSEHHWWHPGRAPSSHVDGPSWAHIIDLHTCQPVERWTRADGWEPVATFKALQEF